mgnify:CR=1 FL=1
MNNLPDFSGHEQGEVLTKFVKGGSNNISRLQAQNQPYDVQPCINIPGGGEQLSGLRGL